MKIKNVRRFILKTNFGAAWFPSSHVVSQRACLTPVGVGPGICVFIRCHRNLTQVGGRILTWFKAQALGPDYMGLHLTLATCHLPPVQPWANDFIASCLSFPIGKAGLMTIPLRPGLLCGANKWYL